MTVRDDAQSNTVDSLRCLETKVPPPVVALVIVAGMWLLAWVTPVVPLADFLRVPIACVLAAGGLAFGLAGSLAFRRAGTTVNPLKPERASQLVISGVYRITRNPMYLGLLLGLVALAAYLAAPLTLAGPALFAMYTHRFQIKPEERALEAKFGSTYIGYRQRVRRWL